MTLEGSHPGKESGGTRHRGTGPIQEPVSSRCSVLRRPGTRVRDDEPDGGVDETDVPEKETGG